MIKKNKDYFEDVLSDVKPLKKRKSTSYKKIDKSKIVYQNLEENIDKDKYEPKPENPKSDKKNSIKNAINEKSNFFKKLKKGKVKINKTVDLHGHSLTLAEERFDMEISESFISGTRCILFITGKGLMKNTTRDSSTKLYYGKIRSGIQKWIYKKSNYEKILYFSSAHISHGGEGSFYVYLRKKT